MSTPRTEMKCEVCGCFSSARICWYCTNNPAAAKVIELQQKLAEAERQNENSLEKVVIERDNAEAALSAAYYLVMGRSSEWSNNFGYREALEEIKDAAKATRSDLLTAQSRIVELSGVLENLNAAAADAVTWCDDDEPYRVKFKKALVDSFDALSSTPPPPVVPRAVAEGLSKALSNMLYDDPSKQENVIGSRNALAAYEATKAK